MREIKFSHHYSKLNDNLFTTIRRYDRYNVGEEVIIRTPERSFSATILHKFKARIGELNPELLYYDTDKTNLGDVFALFNSFYRNKVTSLDRMTVLILKNNHNRGND